MACACGCLSIPRDGKAFVHGHNLRAVNAKLTTEDRRRLGHLAAATKTREEWAALGRQGGRTTNVKRWAGLLAMWTAMSPREALRAAYDAGYNAGYQAQRLVRKAGV